MSNSKTEKATELLRILESFLEKPFFRFYPEIPETDLAKSILTGMKEGFITVGDERLYTALLAVERNFFNNALNGYVYGADEYNRAWGRITVPYSVGETIHKAINGRYHYEHDDAFEERAQKYVAASTGKTYDERNRPELLKDLEALHASALEELKGIADKAVVAGLTTAKQNLHAEIGTGFTAREEERGVLAERARQ